MEISSTNKRVAFHTFGCKLNFSETSTIRRNFVSKGYEEVSFQDTADIYVINTCSVTDSADKKCLQLIKEANTKNTNARIIVVGCYAQLKPKEVQSVEGVDVVLSTKEKFNIEAYLNESFESKAYNIKDVEQFEASYSKDDRMRAFLKIQDGCDYFCSFCTIPLARGKSRSSSIQDILSNIDNIATTDTQEIVLTGVNIGDFKNDKKETFFDVVQALERYSNPAIKQYRISSIEPNLLTENMIDYLRKSSRFVPHFHIPLQSGSDAILQKMRRKYDTSLYRQRIEYLNKNIKNVCIGVDVIVGFPGETEAYFKETFDFLHSLDISYLHVFPYSKRTQTTAVKLNNHISDSIKKYRAKMLRNLSEKKRHAFYLSQLGKYRKAIFEPPKKDTNTMFGITDNYVKISAPYDSKKIRTIQDVYLSSIGVQGNVLCKIL